MIDDIDRAIVTGLRARDMAAFDRLYGRYRERIWAFLVRLTRDRAEAEDLFQETWISAAKHGFRLEDGSDVRAWLYAIARNKHRSARRFVLFDTRRKESFALEEAPRPDAPDQELERRRALRAVESAMAGMSEAHREVLLLSVIEGLETSAIGEILSLKEDAVRKRLSRARQELTDALALAEKRPRPEAGKATTP